MGGKNQEGKRLQNVTEVLNKADKRKNYRADNGFCAKVV